MKVIFLGLSNKFDKPPLCKSTKSGALIHTIIDSLGLGDVDNLVGFAPVDSNGKLRYPTKRELRVAVKKLETKYQPETIFVCLGNIVYSTVPTYYKKIHLQHPAYAIRQGRIFSEHYIEGALSIINQALKGGEHV